MNFKLKKKIMVHAYKRNNWLYRVWEFPQIVASTNDYICVYLKKCKVITSEKVDSENFFHSSNKKNAFWFFFPSEWFNIIATIEEDFKVISYYVNIASPFIFEEEAIKYYDFDLDVIMKSNDCSKFKVLDKNEYKVNKVTCNYEKTLQDKIEETIKLFENKEFREEIISKINLDLLNTFIKNHSLDISNKIIKRN
ncbi:MAG: DUF402 domain-containing protein [Malacoplasma sp.]